MFGTSTHYELQVRKGRSWTVVEVVSEREEAMKKAEALWAAGQQEGIKLLKETFDKQENSFSSLEIFSRGADVKKQTADSERQVSPCLTPNEIYSRDGRKTIWDLLHNTLSDWGVTPIELLHCLDHYYKLYNTGMKLEDAIQRTVVAYDDDGDSIQVRMRKLRKVIDACVGLLKAAKEEIPVLETGRLKPLVAKLGDRQNRGFLLSASLTNYLKTATGLEDKFGRLIVFVSPNRPDWVQDILDQFLSELLQIEQLLKIMLADRLPRAEYLTALIHLAGGSLDTLEKDVFSVRLTQDILSLNDAIAKSLVPQVSGVIRKRLTKEIFAPIPLCEGSPFDQMRTLRRLRDTAFDQGFDDAYLDQVDDSIKHRMARLVNPQNIGDHLSTLTDPFDQVSFLLDLCGIVIGEANKRTVGNYILPALSSPHAESIFMGLNGKPMARMPELVALQKRVLESALSEMHRRKIAEKLDGFCRTVIDSTNLLQKIHAADQSVQEKAMRLLQMLTDGYFTDGDARNRAESQALIYMRSHDFTDGLIGLNPDETAEGTLLEFRKLLQASGLADRHARQQSELQDSGQADS